MLTVNVIPFGCGKMNIKCLSMFSFVSIKFPDLNILS